MMGASHRTKQRTGSKQSRGMLPNHLLPRPLMFPMLYESALKGWNKCVQPCLSKQLQLLIAGAEGIVEAAVTRELLREDKDLVRPAQVEIDIAQTPNGIMAHAGNAANLDTHVENVTNSSHCSRRTITSFSQTTRAHMSSSSNSRPT